MLEFNGLSYLLYYTHVSVMYIRFVGLMLVFPEGYYDFLILSMEVEFCMFWCMLVFIMQTVPLSDHHL